MGAKSVVKKLIVLLAAAMLVLSTATVAFAADSPQASDQGVYTYTKGDGSSWTKGSSASLEFVLERNVDDAKTFGNFLGITIDNAFVDPSNYEYKEGSVVINLKPAYLETLKTGKHTIESYFNDATKGVVASFTINAKGSKASTSKATTGATSPKTGVASDAMLFALAGVALAGLAIGFSRKKEA